MGIKEMMIKRFLRFKIIRDLPGQLVIRFDNNTNIQSEGEQYESLLVKGVKLLDGINDLQFDYSRNLIGISYDIKKLQTKKVLAWIQIIMDTLVDNFSFIKDNWERNSNVVVNKIESQLKTKKQNLYK
ncbi:hypothetical protein [Clostridium gasigenes]|uniref:Uncharacterized protein n=1 Tax=Clostridium gasigenes TaxID=94869 RepID=A0A1H0UC85_9CLOT|nr:hypothetical protein [Clostridium gasigenes]MBB6716085.1 hypothetical protein [Clostridium gasigenes]MBU3090277.1 hypothetical protein [Clostridium gasigenes]MBU3102737.1 hypothetical protein [Clostridium gasigenes]MBU3131350.1 hypothetical protein [Clostridium gasigenes]MBU3134853.1 hypothetical protein [Clostridium gasigenes]